MESDPPIKEPETFPIPGDAKPSLFALVIGIDDYQNVQKLAGAVSDANAVDAYLQRHLGVPKKRIINLRDKAATRQGIIRGFRALQKNPDINTQDAIFIYFAGHGSEKRAPAGWEAGGCKIQAILPQDTGARLSSSQIIHAIPDRTVAALLNDLAGEKGNNITVVFDCCHSSSGTRDDKDVSGRVARVADVQGDIPLDLDKNILVNQVVGRDMKVPTGFLQSHLRSHVLLAACGAEELAWETHGRGAFTAAFLETLIAAGADNVTYTGLMQRLPSLPNQNPQCEGHYKDRIFLNAKVPVTHRFFVGIEEQDNTYMLKAGFAQGITVGSEFNVYSDHVESLSNPPIATLRVKSSETFRAVLEPLDNTAAVVLPMPAYARQVRCGPGHELRVHFKEPVTRALSAEKVQHALLAKEADVGFVLTPVDEAELLVDVIDEKAVFFTTNTLAKEYKFDRLPHDTAAKAEDISHVLRSAARWNWHLKRTNARSHPFSRLVDLEFTRLEQVEDNFDGEGMPVMKPLGENMNRTGIVDMVVDPDHLFGVRIVNRTTRDLYPYLFYFDVSDQSIEPYYLGSISKDRVDPPLRAGSSLTIGYGASGEVPFAFHLRDDEEVDIGFLKVFLMTSQTDFGSLQQSSPFDRVRVPLKKTEVMNKLTREDWDTVMATVVQRAKPSSPSVPLHDGTQISSSECRKWWSFIPRFNIVDRLKSILFS